MPEVDLHFDLERIIPDLLSETDPLEQATLSVHRARYAFAASHARGRRVLDIACGAGYGAAMLRDAGALEVTGVDVSAAAIAHARGRYGRDGVNFVEADAFAFTPSGAADAIVSLETIEHVAEPGRLLQRFASILPAGALFVGSVPVTMSTDINPYHLHDFSADGFRALVRDCGFEPFAEMSQVQRVTPGMIGRARRSDSRRDYATRPSLPLYYAAHPTAALRRVVNTLRHGFDVKYLVLACQRTAGNEAADRT